MKKAFRISASGLPAGKSHNNFPQRGYPNSHPYLYHATDSQNAQVYILSRRTDYYDGQNIFIDCSQIFGGSFYLDDSPANNIHLGPAARRQASTPQTPPGEVNSDVIVMVKSTKVKNGLTEVSGEIFYVDPKLKGLTAPDLRSAFKDSAKITVMTNQKEYNFPTDKTYIFEKLRDVSVSNNIINATDSRVPKP